MSCSEATALESKTHGFGEGVQAEMMDNNFLERLDCLGTSLERAHDGANVLRVSMPIMPPVLSSSTL
jgi:hypothetical protein